MKVKLDYYLDKRTHDIYKGIEFGDQLTGYVKYKHVDFKTARSNKYGYYEPLHYPFGSFNAWSVNDCEYVKAVGSYIPKLSLDQVEVIDGKKLLKERLNEEHHLMELIKEMLEKFSVLKDYNEDYFGLDASLQCNLEMESSDIDLVVSNPVLYLQIYNFIQSTKDFEPFLQGLVARRGRYSSFVSVDELKLFESRKISFIYKGVKVSILYIETVELEEELVPTDQFIYLQCKPGMDKVVGEPSLCQINNYEVIYGPKLDSDKKVFYFSVLPVRTGFYLKKEDTLAISGKIYVGKNSGNIYVSQFIWDYCRMFQHHNVALNTHILTADTDHSIIASFYDNLKV